MKASSPIPALDFGILRCAACPGLSLPVHTRLKPCEGGSWVIWDNFSFPVPDFYLPDNRTQQEFRQCEESSREQILPVLDKEASTWFNGTTSFAQGRIDSGSTLPAWTDLCGPASSSALSRTASFHPLPSLVWAHGLVKISRLCLAEVSPAWICLWSVKPSALWSTQPKT